MNAVYSNITNLTHIMARGVSGSSKGEFVWHLMDKYKETASPEFSLLFIEVESLVAANMKQRIMDLVREGNRFCSTIDSTEDLEGVDAMSETESSSHLDVKLESMKNLLQEFSNVITSTWIFKLIHEEMTRLSACSANPKSIFIVNLVPNRITLFKRSLFLNQSPNMYQLPFDFIALNVCNTQTMSNDSIPETDVSFSDNVNQMFIKYFRSINKLVDVVWQPDNTARVTRIRAYCDNEKTSRGQKVRNQSEITRLLSSENTSRTLMLNITDLPSPPHTCPGIAFIVDNVLQVDENTEVELDISARNSPKVKTLLHYLRCGKRVLDEGKDLQSLSISSPRSPASVSFSNN